MVTDTIDRRMGDRGQLVLIGAITIAFILLGVVVVFNSVQYTHTIDSGSAASDANDVELVEIEIERAVENYSEAEGISNPTESELQDFLDDYADNRSTQSPVSIHIVDVEVDNGEVTVQYSYHSSDVAVVNRTVEVDTT